jgi:hypothetical protein
LSKNCQKNIKVVKKWYKFKTSGEDDDDAEEEKEIGGSKTRWQLCCTWLKLKIETYF